MSRLKQILTLLILVSCFFVSCEKKDTINSSVDREALEKLVRSNRSIDSLSVLAERFEKEGNRLGSVIAMREWGKLLRNESRFDEALDVHMEGLRKVEAIHDTLEWVQALNNIGTDYRRMGVLDVAQEYHYRAKTLSEDCSDTTSAALKNLQVSLNGLGNIYLTLGDYDLADSTFRQALVGEKQLGSALGQAINYANIGSILETKGQIDSAWVYYRLSMAFNQEAGSDLGVSLCHTHFGSLYEKEGKYDLAKEEYEKAYGLMKESEDEYHALNSLLAMAGIHITTGEYSSAMEYLVKAESMADRIGSKEHIIEADLLYYDLYKKRGDYKRALQRLEMADSVKNSVMSVENINRVQNNLLTIERNRRSTQINEARLKLENERDKRRFLYVLLSFVVLFFTAVILVLMYIQRLRERNHSALMRMSTMREHFFTNITHEFRTPLTVILGLSDQIKKNDSLATETREKASVIERQGNGLLALVNQLMDISKIKSAVGDPDWRHGDITTYIAMVMESWKEVALSRNIDLQYTQSGPVEMDFVPEYINKVLANLLSNAFKFTPEYGRVDVSVKRDGPRLLMDVSDTGVGVDEESIAHIFEPFYQARNAASHIGSGVGLALVKQIMDSLEGTISVDSSLGKGTVFHLAFPIANNHVRPFEAPEPIIDEYEDSDALADANDEDGKPRVLIIEDNRDVAAYIGSGLLNDYSVFYARDGKEGYDKTLELVPDLIITDLMMPGMSGLDICRSVRKQDIVSHIPIIVVTAKASEEDKIKGIEAGADAYIPKPFNSDELAAWVDKLLKDRRRLRELYVRKMIEAKDDAKEKKDTALNEADLRFLSKLADTVIMRLDRGSDIEIPTLASSMCMSVSQFYRKMTALTGFSPAAYILRLRIKKAQQLIDENTEMTLGEVADETGFKDYSNFVRAFKNIRGLTPSEYRGSKNLP